MSDPARERLELDSTARKQLRGLAHHLKPVVFVGQSGLSPSVLREIDDALTAHELIKVKFVQFKEHRKEIAQEMADRCAAGVAGVVGNVAILYRPHPESARRKIQLDPR